MRMDYYIGKIVSRGYILSFEALHTLIATQVLYAATDSKKKQKRKQQQQQQPINHEMEYKLIGFLDIRHTPTS